MENPLATLKRLPTQLRGWLHGHRARWTGTRDTVTETATWSVKDLLGSASDLPAPSDAVQDALSDDVLTANDPRFFGREAALEALAAALDEWRSGRGGMLAVQGPQGSGVSSLLAQLPTLLTADDILVSERFCTRLRTITDVTQLIAQSLQLAPVPESIDDLLGALQQLPPRIIVLDDAHLLAFRVMGTRTAVRTLGSIMVASQPGHLWILGFRRHAWQRLIYLHQADRYFSRTIELDYFSSDELKTVITQRCAAAQIELDWATADWNRLYQYSRGKPDLAFRYSQRLYAERLAGNDQPEVLRPVDLSTLKSLEMEDLFCLAELAVHGHLRGEEHRQIFRETTDGSLMRLGHLCNLGLVERFTPACGDTTPRYRITPILSGLIADHLYKVNYLY